AKAAAGAGHHSGRRVGRMLRAIAPNNVVDKLGHGGKE
ncbi:2-C-methyl-D-erythritol 4-phosphate cytidylyltransferase, partial [Agrobacterium vitis]|nr:2-C-methyl-D-erythritol 4-phosphate cytidylyltransferase [Agrobacterium vitis]